MSKGNKIVKVRMEPALLEELERQLASRNEHCREAPWTLSDFVRDCVRERLTKRARRKRGLAQAGA